MKNIKEISIFYEDGTYERFYKDVGVIDGLVKLEIPKVKKTQEIKKELEVKQEIPKKKRGRPPKQPPAHIMSDKCFRPGQAAKINGVANIQVKQNGNIETFKDY